MMNNYPPDQVLAQGVRVQVWVPDYIAEDRWLFLTMTDLIRDKHGKLGTVVGIQRVTGKPQSAVELDDGTPLLCWPRELRPGVTNG